MDHLSHLLETIEAIKFINEQDFNRLPVTGNVESADGGALDDDAIRAQNALLFYRFELQLPRVSGTYDQLKHVAAVRGQLDDGKGGHAGVLDGQAWALEKINASMEDEATRRVSEVSWRRDNRNH